MSFKFRKVGGRTYRSWTKWSEGDVLIAKYTESYEDQFGNTCYEVQVIESDFSNEEENLDEGALLGVNSCGSLNNKMKGVEIGSVLRIEYAGKGKIDKGPMAGKSFHNVNLGVDATTAGATPIASKIDEEDTKGEDYDL